MALSLSTPARAWDWDFTTLITTVATVVGAWYAWDWLVREEPIKPAYSAKNISWPTNRPGVQPITPVRSVPIQTPRTQKKSSSGVVAPRQHMPRVRAATKPEPVLLVEADEALAQTDIQALSMHNMPEAAPAVQPITIKDHRCYGWQRVVQSKNGKIISLKQPIVAYQGLADNVSKGGAASCGYHSLKNFCIMAQYLAGTLPFNVGKVLCSADIVNALFKIDENGVGTWRNKLLQENPHLATRRGELIEEQHIQDILDTAVQPGGFLEGLPVSFQVIEDVTNKNINVEGLMHLDHQFRRQRESSLNSTRTLMCEGIQVHGFILNDIAKEDKIGHWFAVVVYIKRDGSRDYIILDSINCNRLHNKSVNALVQVLGDNI